MRVLLVEDNVAMADALQRGFVSAGFVTDLAISGDDGLWRAREFSYDLYIFDVLLPGINGFELCRTLRADGDATPILMLTAKAGSYDVAEGLDLGADDYVTKPFSFVELVARVRALLRRTGPDPTSEEIVVGDLTLNTTTRRCHVSGQQLDLTSREYDLLETLVRRLDEPCRRGELLDHVWGVDTDYRSNVVDVYVGYLRKKLRQAGGDAVVIETVRGVGYRLIDPGHSTNEHDVSR